MTTQAPALDTDERTDARALTLPLVLAQGVQNIMGGVGAGVAVAGVLWLAGADLAAYWRWPLGVAVVVAGAATAWRAYLDEWRADRRWHKREHEHAEECALLADTCDELEEQLNAEREQHALQLQAATDAMRAEQRRADQLEVDLAWERTQHRRAQAGPLTVQTVDLVPAQLKADCRRWVELWATSGKRPSRTVMMGDGLTRARWDEMVVELKRAGVWEWAGEFDAARLHMRLDAQWAHPPTPRDGGRDGQVPSSAGGAGLPPTQE